MKRAAIAGIVFVSIGILGVAAFGIWWQVTRDDSNAVRESEAARIEANAVRESEAARVEANARVCDAARTWRDMFEQYQVTVSTADRLTQVDPATYERFRSMANVTIPFVEGKYQNVSSAINDVNTNNEKWLNILAFVRIFRNASTVTAEQTVNAIRESEAMRIEANASVRAANSVLTTICGIQPIKQTT